MSVPKLGAMFPILMDARWPATYRTAASQLHFACAAMTWFASLDPCIVLANDHPDRARAVRFSFAHYAHAVG